MRFKTVSGFYELNPFPGCSQLVVSNHAFVRKELRGKGAGRTAHRARLQHARDLGYDAIICTVRADNAAQKHILSTEGWQKSAEFFNKETERFVEIWTKVL